MLLYLIRHKCCNSTIVVASEGGGSPAKQRACFKFKYLVTICKITLREFELSPSMKILYRPRLISLFYFRSILPHKYVGTDPAKLSRRFVFILNEFFGFKCSETGLNTFFWSSTESRPSGLFSFALAS